MQLHNLLLPKFPINRSLTVFLISIFQERERELNEDLERVKDMAQKLIDMMPRYGHEMTTKRMSRFRALATYQPTLGNRWIKVILKRPELLDEVASQDLMAFVDFCLLDLRLTKTSSFDLVCSLPIVLFDQPSVYKELLLNWVALCEKNGLNVRLVIDNPKYGPKSSIPSSISMSETPH